MEKTIKSQQNTVKKATAKKPVKAKSNAAKDLRALFEDELKDMYGAEKALVKALPKMIQNANSKELAKAITNHLKVTEQQVKSVEAVFQAIGKKAQAKKCLAMEGLIKEAEELMKSAQEGDVRDAGIISASQKVEHYEIASYGTLCSFAKSLGETEAAKILQTILNQEYDADKKLTEISTRINPQAKQNGSTSIKSAKPSSSAKKVATTSKSSPSAKKSSSGTAKKPGPSAKKTGK
jgi:ferritin-like metal-binding protein YciE